MALQAFVAEFLDQFPAAVALIGIAYALNLLTWPFFLWLERRTPAGGRTPGSNFVFNWKVVLSNLALTPVFYALAVAGTVLVARTLGLPALPYPAIAASFGTPVLDIAAQGFVFFVTATFLGDLWYYWWHRMQHEIPALWEFHKLHHSDENLNVTSIFRSHFLELVGQALVRGMTVGLIFDINGAPETLAAILFAGLLPPIWDFFIHANVRLDSLHRLTPMLSNPQYHWIHHSKLPQHQDKNYAIWLPLFDVLFGTYYRGEIDEYPPTGLSSGEKIETLWVAQVGPFAACWNMLRGARGAGKRD